MNDVKYKQSEIGEIPEDWCVGFMKDHFLIKGRIGWKGLKKSEYLDEGYAIINGLQIQDGFVNWADVGRISKERFDESPEIILKERDILMTKDGTIGKLAFIDKLPGPSTVASGVFVIRSSSEYLDSVFLYYYLQSGYFRSLVRNRIEGAVIPHLYQRDINELLVPLPPFQEQQQIVSTLSSLDRKIELDRRVNRTIEEMGKTLFKHWFVDFEFSNEDKKPYKTSGGEMIDSELGKIPKGWEVKDLNSVSEIKNGFAFKSEDYTDKGVFLLRTRNFSQSGYVTKNEVVFLPNGFLEKYKNFQLQKFDVLLVMVGASVGNLGFVTSNVLPALQNQNMWNFRARNVRDQLFIKFLVENIVKENIGSASGSARDFFRKDFFRTIKIILPNEPVLERFSDVVDILYEKLNENLTEIEGLIQIRDSLLPRLMSGKLRVN